MSAPATLSIVTAVLRGRDSARVAAVSEALAEAGIGRIELTLTTPGTLGAVRTARAAAAGRALVGVGTVLDRGTAAAAVESGAEFLVTPGVVPEVAEIASAQGIPLMMGALSPSEVMRAAACGADEIKIFPASAVGPGYLRALAGPLPQLRFVPSGGVDAARATAWLRAGAAGLSIGGPLIGDALDGGPLPALRERLAELRAALQERS